MKILSLFLFAASTLASASVADTYVRTPNITYVIPASSPLRAGKIGEFNTVHYKGSVEITGEYTYGFADAIPEEDVEEALALTFTMDEAGAKQLPYWDRDGPERDIWIRNDKDFAQAVVSADDLARLASKEIRQVSGTVTISVRDVETTIDCDKQTTSADFVSVRGQKDPRVATNNMDLPAC